MNTILLGLGIIIGTIIEKFILKRDLNKFGLIIWGIGVITLGAGIVIKLIG